MEPTLEELYGMLPVAVVPEADVGLPSLADLPEPDLRASAEAAAAVTPRSKLPVRPIDAMPVAEPAAEPAGTFVEQGPPLPPELRPPPPLSEAERLRSEGLDLVNLAGQYSVGKSKRPLYNETNQRISVGEQSAQKSSEAQKQLLAEQDITARFLADENAKLAQWMQNNALDEKAALFAETERRERIIQESEEQDRRVTAAAQHLSNAPPMDPGRWWKDQSAGRKAGFVIASIFMGMARQDPLKLINTAIERDIAAQESDYNRRKDTLAVEGQRLEQKHNLWADIRANALTDDEARLQIKNAYLESFKQHLVAGLHERGVAELQPMHQQILAQIEDQQAANTLRWQQLRAANTKYVYHKQYAIRDPAARKFLRKMGEKEYEAGIEEGANVRKGARELQAAATLEGVKAGLKGGDVMGSSGMTEDDMRNIRAAGSDNKYMAARAMKPIVERMQGIIQQAGGTVPDVYGPAEFGGEKETFSLPGALGGLTTGGLVGAAIGGFTADPAGRVLRSDVKGEWDREADAGLEVMVNYFTGAVASPEQRAIAERAFGKHGVSAAERVKAINQLSKMLDDWINIREGMLTDEQREFIHRNPDLTGISPSSVTDSPAREALEGDLEYD